MAIKPNEGKRIVKIIRAGMVDAEVKNLLELSEASGVGYKTLCRRMQDGSKFTVGELYMISRVIPLKVVDV